MAITTIDISIDLKSKITHTTRGKKHLFSNSEQNRDFVEIRCIHFLRGISKIKYSPRVFFYNFSSQNVYCVIIIFCCDELIDFKSHVK